MVAQTTIVALTEKVLASCKSYKVGKLVNNLLRGLLERGVAAADIGSMQKASGETPVKTLKIQKGKYCNYHFNISLPLLIDPEHYQYDDQANFWNPISVIDGKEFHLCSKWNEGKHRKSVENWIRGKLPEWFKNKTTTNEQREEMKKFLDNPFL